MRALAHAFTIQATSLSRRYGPSPSPWVVSSLRASTSVQQDVIEWDPVLRWGLRITPLLGLNVTSLRAGAKVVSALLGLHLCSPAHPGCSDSWWIYSTYECAAARWCGGAWLPSAPTPACDLATCVHVCVRRPEVTRWRG